MRGELTRVPLLALLAALLAGRSMQLVNCDTVETIETLEFKDSRGVERVEFAFRAPMRGTPEKVLELYCVNVKLRLYWGVFREEVINPLRKGLYLRRLARLTRHLFSEVADVDKPYNAERLSTVDYWMAVADKPKGASGDESEGERDEEADVEPEEKRSTFANFEAKIKGLLSRRKESEPTTAKPDTPTGEGGGELELADAAKQEEAIKRLLEAEGGPKERGLSLASIKTYIKELAPKVALGVYTRYRTMWWMMMSCLFTKYYLWDPALDEFMKLKRALQLYPELQLMRLQDLQCQATKFFAHIIDVCKILNPLFHLNFGTLNLDKLTKFKSDQRNPQ